MANPTHQTVLITGANTGLGKEAARQLGLRDDVQRVYLACRNDEKAAAAQAELVAAVGRSIFTRIRVDIADLDSVRGALDALDEPLDAIIMNAGGVGGPEPMGLTDAGVTHLFASNVYGHVALLEGIVARGGLRKAALLSSSEAARGIPRMKVPRPVFADYSVEEFASVIDGSFFERHRYRPLLAYGQVKYLGSLWMAAKARQHPSLRLISMSPGGTAGTQSTRDMPMLMRWFTDRVFMAHIAPRVGLGHRLEVGAQRLVEGITNPEYTSGAFYASGAKVVTGPVIDQAELAPELADPRIQDNADAAIHRFIPHQVNHLSAPARCQPQSGPA